MSILRFLLLPPLLLLLGAGATLAPGGGPSPHLGEFDRIRQEAKERNVPLAIFVIQEGEEANDRFRDEVYFDETVIAAGRDVIVMLVNDGEHPPKKIREKGKGDRDGGAEREVCSVYETPTCAAHSRYFHRIFQEYKEGDVVRTPQLLLVLPDGKVHRRLIDEHEPKTVVRAFEETGKVAGPSLSLEELNQVKRDLSAGRAAMNRERFAEAWHAWHGIGEKCPAGPYAKEAREGMAEAELGMREDLAAAHDLFAEGKITRGYARLIELRGACAGTPLEKETDRAVRAAEKNKEWKEEIEAHQREVEAKELWDKIVALLAEDKVRAAERQAKRILTRYPKTRAADYVRREFPELEESEGGEERG